MRRRGLPFSILVVLAFTAALVFTGLASAATSTPVGTSYTVNATPGADHTDPHIDGNLIAYTTATPGVSSIHYYSLLTATDATIPNGGAFDFLSGVNAGRIVFSRSTPGTNGAIWLYDTTNAANPGPVPLANQPGSEVCLSQSHRSGSGLRLIGGAPAVGFDLLGLMVNDAGPAGVS